MAVICIAHLKWETSLYRRTPLRIRNIRAGLTEDGQRIRSGSTRDRTRDAINDRDMWVRNSVSGIPGRPPTVTSNIRYEDSLHREIVERRKKLKDNLTNCLTYLCDIFMNLYLIYNN